MSDKTATAPEPAATGQRPEREPDYPMVPPADVLEDGDGITLRLDMPGVSKDRLTVLADKNTLLIEGVVHIAMPQGMEALYAEIQSTGYRRRFTLSGELDAEKTVANVSNGVLTVRIPKRAELRPRKIEVKVS
jgi:HSP20 family molecular chaperone IbpA